MRNVISVAGRPVAIACRPLPSVIMFMDRAVGMPSFAQDLEGSIDVIRGPAVRADAEEEVLLIVVTNASDDPGACHLALNVREVDYDGCRECRLRVGNFVDPLEVHHDCFSFRR